jgi:hypothetical protein
MRHPNSPKCASSEPPWALLAQLRWNSGCPAAEIAVFPKFKGPRWQIVVFFVGFFQKKSSRLLGPWWFGYQIPHPPAFRDRKANLARNGVHRALNIFFQRKKAANVPKMQVEIRFRTFRNGPELT